MRNTRKKKTPVTLSSSADSGSSNPYTTRTLIRRFHVLLKRQRQFEKNPTSVCNTNALRDVEQEIERLGGLSTYQRMSRIGQGVDRGGGSEKVLIDWLVEMGVQKRGDASLLEVGAVKPDNYASCSSWMATTAIDLKSQHPSIVEQDFFALNMDEHTERWDVISLSLVVNFVPEPTDRGRMLTLAHTFLRPSGLLFLALPSACVVNSRYMSFDHLDGLMSAIGFVPVEKKWREGRKMAYWLYKKTMPERPLEEFRKRRTCRGGRRNNFCILL